MQAIFAKTFIYQMSEHPSGVKQIKLINTSQIVQLVKTGIRSSNAFFKNSEH